MKKKACFVCLSSLGAIIAELGYANKHVGEKGDRSTLN